MRDVWLKKEVPAWYRIGLQDREAFYVEVHREAFWEIRHHLEETSHVVQRQIERLPGLLAPFSPFFQKRGDGCGFGAVLKRVTDFDSEWIRYRGVFPTVKRALHPDGMQTDEWNVRATLRALFSTLAAFEGRTSAAVPQLMVVTNLSISGECDGGALEVICTPPLCRWISGSGYAVLTSVENAMHRAGTHMWQQVTDRSHYEVRRLGHGLLIIIPGNACSILPDPEERRKAGHGFTFTSYNTDSSLQQLTFLAGLARLHDIASADLARTILSSRE